MSKTTEHNSEASFEVRELTDAELDYVSGGKAKLLEAAVKGHVFKTVEIHGTA